MKRGQWAIVWFALGAVTVGCQSAPRRTAPLPAPVSPELRSGQRALLAGHPAVAVGHFNLYRAEAARLPATAGADRAAEADYWLGLCELQLDRPRVALVYLQQAAAAEGPDEVTALARLAAGCAAYRLDAYDEAQAFYEGLTGPLLARVPVDEVWYRKALALRRKGRREEAAALLRQVAARFPDSPLAAEARREADRLPLYFSCQIGWFTRRTNAEGLAETVRRVGFDSRVEPGERKGAAGFAVMVGRYAAFADARTTAERLKRAGFEAFVVP